jgi:hypothetical protein
LRGSQLFSGPILARIEERLAGIETDLLDLTKRLIGNGNPGIILKLTGSNRSKLRSRGSSGFWWRRLSDSYSRALYNDYAIWRRGLLRTTRSREHLG